MEKLRYIVIPAGGKGYRLHGYKNPLGCKPLILAEDGHSLLYHTIRKVMAADVCESLLITTRCGVGDHVRRIVKELGAGGRIEVLIMPEENESWKGLRSILVELKDRLGGDAFGLVCGTAPAPSEHLKKMLEIRRSAYDQVASVYSGDHYRGDRVAVTLEYNHSLSSVVLVNSGEGGDVSYIKTPYILTPDSIRDIELYGKSVTKTLFDQMRAGKQICGVTADFPKEPDTVEELERILAFVSI